MMTCNTNSHALFSTAKPFLLLFPYACILPPSSRHLSSISSIAYRLFLLSHLEQIGYSSNRLQNVRFSGCGAPPGGIWPGWWHYHRLYHLHGRHDHPPLDLAYVKCCSTSWEREFGYKSRVRLVPLQCSIFRIIHRSFHFCHLKITFPAIKSLTLECYLHVWLHPLHIFSIVQSI